MIRRLHEGLGIAAEVLIRPSRQSDTPQARKLRATAKAGAEAARSSFKAGGRPSRRRRRDLVLRSR